MGSEIISLKNVELKDSVHVDVLNKTLYSAGQIYDTGQIVVNTRSEAFIISQDQFSIGQSKRYRNTCKKNFEDSIL